ncbi:type IV pilus assembly protein PilM [Candidatus Nomurabacteria bacterium]|nr:type IV pilus assembly protein PilM [Candidatus Nomurabacteria bacterium]
MITNPFENAFGLDISDLSMKVVQLQGKKRYLRTPSYKLKAARSITLPYGLIVNGELEQPEMVRKYLMYLLEGNPKKNQKPINGPWVVASLPENRNFIKQIAIDKEPDDIVEEDILYLVKKHFPFEDNEYHLDWQLLPTPSRNKSVVLMGAAPKHVADMYTYLLESVGLGIVGLDIESLATARSMITAEKEYVGEARAILDIGATKTIFIVYDNNSVKFSQMIPFSGELINTALTQKLKIDFKKAEELKIQYGCEFDSSKKEVWDVISGLIGTLVSEIEKALRFYYSHFENANKINHITMCGGVTNMKKLPELLSEKLGIESEPGHVWKNLRVHNTKSLPSEKALSFATAIGLALRAADNPYTQKDSL